MHLQRVYTPRTERIGNNDASAEPPHGRRNTRSSPQRSDNAVGYVLWQAPTADAQVTVQMRNQRRLE